jgi:hypothetical protein
MGLYRGHEAIVLVPTEFVELCRYGGALLPANEK